MKLQRWISGCISRRECLVPTWKGWLLCGFLSIALLAAGVLRVHPFLALTAPVPAHALVVEGWVPDYVLYEARMEFQRNHYSKLYVTGGPLEVGGYLSEYKTYAELGAATLIRMGMSSDELDAVPAPRVPRDRTYASAVALKDWLSQHNASDASINVVSMGAHARRSRLLFRKAFGDDSRVGIIAIDDRDYDPKHWWKFSQGVRTVIDEFIAYIYAAIIFPLA